MRVQVVKSAYEMKRYLASPTLAESHLRGQMFLQVRDCILANKNQLFVSLEERKQFDDVRVSKTLMDVSFLFQRRYFLAGSAALRNRFDTNYRTKLFDF